MNARITRCLAALSLAASALVVGCAVDPTGGEEDPPVEHTSQSSEALRISTGIDRQCPEWQMWCTAMGCCIWTDRVCRSDGYCANTVKGTGTGAGTTYIP